VTRAEWEEIFARGLIIDPMGEPMAADHIVRVGERYRRVLPNTTEPDVNAAVEILHEDEALIVLNKPAPLPMHEGGRFHRNTLAYLLQEIYRPQRPRPAHRLDANTTGVVLVARTRHFAGRLQPQFASGKVEKTYLVRVQGQPLEDAFSCEAPISDEAGELGARTVDEAGGQAADTRFRVLHRHADGTALLEARPLTGRTNQIRIHLWHLGFPVCGDATFLAGKQIGGTQTLGIGDPPLCLHAWKIKFLHPLSQTPAEFTAPPPTWAGAWSQTERPPASPST
jgi:RluA family pseudouridine synthase